MIQLDKALRAWQNFDQTPDQTGTFETVLKHEIAQLDINLLPLQQGLSGSSTVTDDPITVMIHRVVEQQKVILVKAGIFYQGVIGGCSCADDPTPTSTNNEYCEVDVEIDKETALTSIILSAEFKTEVF